MKEASVMRTFKIRARLGFVKVLTAPDAHTAIALTWPDYADGLTIAPGGRGQIMCGRRLLGTITQMDVPATDSTPIEEN